MKMRFEQGLHLKQEASLIQRQELRQELAQKMGYSLEHIREEGSDAPDSLLQSVLDAILNALEDDNLREGLRVLFSDKVFRKSIIDSAMSLATPTPERIQKFILQYLHDSHHGEFLIENIDEDGQVQRREVLKTSRAHFEKALFSPDALRKEYVDLVAHTHEQDAKGENTRGSKNALEEMENAFRVTEANREHISTLATALEAVLRRRANGEPGLSDFLRDFVVLQKLDPILSERTQRRFVANVSHVGEKTSPEKMKNGFLNIVGEYVLVSMGIVHPDVLQRNSAVRTISEYTTAKDTLSEIGMDIDALLQKYQLQAPGTFFWHRWKTMERAPSPITDDLIRAFITKTVRADAEQILNVVQYEEFFENIRAIKTAGESKEETEDNLREALTEALTDDRFETLIIDLIRNKWYAELDLFYAHQD